MAKYTYKAISQDHKVLTGTFEADNKQTVIDHLKKQHLNPVSVSQGKNLDIPFLTNKKVKTKDLALFTRQLSTMISAGVPLNRSFLTLQEQTDNKYFRDVIGDVAKQIESGAEMGGALKKYPKVFDDVYVNMVSAGEAGGILDEILKRLATQLEKSESIRKKVKSATTYPKVVFGITIGAFILVMNLIIPKMGEILYDLGGPDAELPALTKGMIAFSDFMKAYIIPIVIVSAIAIYLLRRYINTPKGKYKFHALLLKMPVIKTVITKIAIASFARTFSSLMSAGVSVTTAIEVTSGAMGNKVLEKELKDAANDVKAGKQLSEPILKSPHYPAIVGQMLAIGEETGETDQILIKIADFYEEEVDATIESMSSILEPLMIVILGGMVGLVAAGVMVPMMSLSQNIK